MSTTILPTHPDDVHPPVAGGGGGGGVQTSLGGGVALAGLLQYPWVNTPSSGSFLALDAAGERAAFIFQVPKTGILDMVEWQAGGITNAPDNPVRVSFQSIDLATGFPDGTQDQFRDYTPVALAWTAPGLMTSDGTDGGSKRSVTRGELLAVVIEFTTFVAGDNFNPLMYTTQWISGGLFPSVVTFLASVWSAASGGHPILALKYSDGTYATPMGCLGAPPGNALTVGNATSPDEVALFFRPPVPLTVGGAFIQVDPNAVDFDVILYSASDVVLTSVSIDGDTLRNANPGNLLVTFPQDVVLQAGETYRLAVKPTTASTLILYYLIFTSAAIMAGAGGGTDVSYSERVDGGAWTNTSLRRLIAGLVLTGASG